uniref:Outer dynein arm docking complex subunit 3 n=1 Tax=Latimeria chalumnae TaxID=7897 RepID=H3B8E3_LATCH|nr:PREDICTED: coiled-coil domain-containing protein 151 isoform X2 [Latimeria chalumnae]|eukprot:XP_005994191.1 PREDICTED: coiled-coil domain-containing protein 151 isoform X2 [Latimeria chalumnae]
MPITLSAGKVKLPVNEQIVELQRKIQLLEGDRKSYYENSQWSISKNKETILWLRQENKILYKKLADTLAGDEKVINEAFQNRNVEKAPLRNKSGPTAIKLVDQKVCDKVKRLNALKHQTEVRRRRLKELQDEYNQKVQEGQSIQSVSEGIADEAKTLRTLENRLEKSQLKCQEANHITQVYQQLKSHLQEESLTFQNQLDSMEVEILRHRQELKDLKAMKYEAQLYCETAKTELQHQEETVYRERKQRERILSEYRKLVEERKAQVERQERRLFRTSLKTDELITAEPSTTGIGEEEIIITNFKEAFQRIKEATGVSDTQEVVQRFMDQEETQIQLAEMKSESEMILARLKEEKRKLLEEFQQMKYSGEAKLSRCQRQLDEFNSSLKKEEKRRDEAKENLEKLSKLLMSVKAAVEHLADKLEFIKLPVGEVSTSHISTSSDGHVLNLLYTIEEKLCQLLEKLEGQDLDEVMKQMEEIEFHTSIEGNLPSYNVRINLPITLNVDIYEDEEESGEDDGDVITRATLKRQSQQIIESKNKKRTRVKRKKGKL